MTKRKIKPAREWQMSLRIPSSHTTDKAPALDPQYLAAKGIFEGAEVVLRLLRDEVLPMVRGIQKERNLAGFHFLIHDRQSGVPTTEDDKAPYIHMRLRLKRAVVVQDAQNIWTLIQPIESGQTSIGGVDLSLVKGKNDVEKVKNFNALIDKQSALILDFIEAHNWGTADDRMLMQTRQWAHFLSNMMQMRIA